MVSETEVKLEYVSAGCNRSPHCLAWSQYVYYGADCGVQVYSVDQARVVTTLTAHTARVNTVRCVRSQTDVEFLLTGSSDHSVAVWRCERGDFTKLAVVKSHTGSVTKVAGLLVESVLFVVSTSRDHTVRLTRINTDSGHLEDDGVISLPGTGLALELHLTELPGLESPVLAVARDDCKIHFYWREGERTWLRAASIGGHEDWVVSLDSRREGEGLVLVSGGQDSLVRMWRLERRRDSRLDTEELSVEEEVVSLAGQEWNVVLESVLAGHEGWVYSVQWSPSSQHLLTASMDKTIMIWGQAGGEDGEEEVWLEQVRVGEVGGNTLGFLGAVWGPSGQQILGHSWGGAFHLWRSDSAGGWEAAVVAGGHQQAVTDLSWEEGGRYLLTVGRDQTARLHSVWAAGDSWQEVGRPQVHGYDMTCCAMLDQHRFVSGAEEKVLRAFSAPSNFLENLGRITGSELELVVGRDLAQGASTPSLGLSNKAVYPGQKETPAEEKHVKDQFPDHYFSPEVTSLPPPEESLVQNTLWPEEHKLYGHGYELFCVAASPDSRLVASACKSTDAASSRVILWDTKTWTEVGGVASHTLTVTQLMFSPDGGKLLCVSRDRTWSLHSLQRTGDRLDISLLARSQKKSSVISRLIWSCCWSHDSRYFITASRDKRLVVWGEVEGGWSQTGETLTLPDSVTAVCLGHRLVEEGEAGQYLVAAGLESGNIHLLTWSCSGGWRQRTVLAQNTAHHATVTRLAFRPGSNSHLASSSQDTSVRIYHVKLL